MERYSVKFGVQEGKIGEVKELLKKEGIKTISKTPNSVCYDIKGIVHAESEIKAHELIHRIYGENRNILRNAQISIAWWPVSIRG